MCSWSQAAIPRRVINAVSRCRSRDMGLVDLVPKIFVPPVIEKLHFVHGLRGVQHALGTSPA